MQLKRKMEKLNEIYTIIKIPKLEFPVEWDQLSKEWRDTAEEWLDSQLNNKEFLRIWRLLEPNIWEIYFEDRQVYGNFREMKLLMVEVKKMKQAYNNRPAFFKKNKILREINTIERMKKRNKYT